ncbi:SET domain-containing protein [Variovorax sp. RT4R15]|uniref:SET domain-containing protein n=1 Tax=Variovorax sp. RT4R15 TaxID=3443737 RepID=UPI003F4673F3
MARTLHDPGMSQIPTPWSSQPTSALDAVVLVRNSGVHGQGVFARRRLAKGTCLGAYEGRRYSADAALLEEWDSGLTYLFALSDGTTIDGGQGGNATRHLNHACVPNCEAREEVASDGAIVLSVFTLRPVAKNAELFLDYALIIDASEEVSDYPCHCGHVACRGTMAAEPI